MAVLPHSSVRSPSSRGLHHDLRDSFLFELLAQLSNSATIVPKRRFCVRASPSRGPVITQTARTFSPRRSRRIALPPRRSLGSPFGQENSRHLHNYIPPRLRS